MDLSSQPVLGYGLAILLSAIAFVLTHVLTPRLQFAPFDLFQGAVVVCAIYAGLGPALLTTLLSIAALDYFFLPPYNSFSLAAADFLQLIVFGSVAVVTSSLSVRLRKATAALQYENSQRLAAEKEVLQISTREQRRLSEDLHDGLLQTLAGLRLLCKDLKERTREAGTTWWGEIEQMETRLGEAITQADIATRSLYPVELESDGLMDALRELSEKVSALYRVDCRFRCTNPVLIENSAAAGHLYRIAQEAIMNALKHGQAHRVTVRLASHGEHIILSVTDDGIGLYKKKPRDGLGLKMMHHRANVMNARLNLRSRQQGCARLTCRYSTRFTQDTLHAAAV